MKIQSVKLKSYRNFVNATVHFGCQSAVIIGANDVGKSNLVWALRLLLDRDLSESQLEPKDSDFNVLQLANDLEIVVEFCEVTEGCVLSKLGQHTSDDGKLFLCYRGRRDPDTRLKSYEILGGHSLDDLQELAGRFYTKVLNLKCIVTVQGGGRYV